MVVRDSTTYSKVQEQVALVHETAHFIFHKLFRTPSESLVPLNLFLNRWGVHLHNTKTIDYVDELLAHYSEIVVAPSLSRLRTFDVLHMLTNFRGGQTQKAIENLPQRIRENYGIEGEASIRMREAPEWLEMMFQTYLKRSKNAENLASQHL